jgi:CRISPR-associated protein (TIGR02584 family)
MSKQSNNKRIVLIATMGSSPAVLTETVWALAHQEKISRKEVKNDR